MIRFFPGIWCLLWCASALSQDIHEEFIMKDTLGDTAVYRIYNVCFDKGGDYCITYKSKGKYYFLTREKQYGPFDSYNSDDWKVSESAYSSKYNDEHNNLHYKSLHGVKVFGPHGGILQDVVSSLDGKVVAASFGEGYRDSVPFFLNEKKLGMLSSYNLFDKVKVNRKGDVLYRIEKGPGKGIYYNAALVDSLDTEYVQDMEMSEQGGYYYFKNSDVTGGTYIRTAAGRDTIFKYGDAAFAEDGSYYVLDAFQGRLYLEGGRQFGFGRDVAFKSHGFRSARDFFLVYRGPNARRDSIMVNGRSYVMPIKYPRYLSFNQPGELSYASNDYGNFFRWKGGVILKRYGQTADHKNETRFRDFRVIYMSPAGDSVLYAYTSAHTTFVKMNDQLLHIVPEEGFAHYPEAHFFEDGSRYRGRYRDDYERLAPQLSYIEVDTAGYFIYKGTFSKPCQPIYKTRHSQKAISYHRYHLRRWGSSLVSSYYGLEGFYFIQERNDGKYWININNKQYHILEGLDAIFPHNVYFDGKELLFYVLGNGAYYRYTIKIN